VRGTSVIEPRASGHVVQLRTVSREPRQHSPPRYNLATVHEVESLLTHLSRSLAKVGFRPHQGDPDSFLRSLRRVLGRAPLEQRDCNVLHRICQQIDYYVQCHEK
jgi:tRNA C32,U32 (ribose-2'-O)-methylase TrmJ